jgi:PEP-CTERM motif-containing protein
MKKLILTTIGLFAGATLIHAQGAIEIAARPAGSVQTNTSSFYAPGAGTAGAIPTQVNAPGAYDFALLIATSTSAGDVSPSGADWTQAQIFGGGGPILVSNSVNIAGGISGTGGAGGVSVAGWAAGTTMDVLLVGWSSNLGSSWSTVSAEFNGGAAGGAWNTSGYFGYSGIAAITSGGAGTPASPPESIFGAGIQGFTLYAVSPTPEPTTLALAGLGGLSMLFLRRRKS